MTKGQIAVTFMDDSERFFPVPEESGWRVRTEYGAPTLVIGRGVPRVEIPLANVRYYEVSPLPSRPSRGPLASIAEAVAAGRCPGCDRPFDAPGVSCHESAGGGWVCSRSVEAAPDPVEVERAVQWAEGQANSRLPKAGDEVRFSGHPVLPDCSVRVEWAGVIADDQRWLLTTETGVRGTVGRPYWVRWDGYWAVVRPGGGGDAPAAGEAHSR